MTAISDATASRALLNLEALRPESAKPGPGDAPRPDNGGTTDCWPVDPDPRDPGEFPQPRDPGDVFEPRDPGGFPQPRDPGDVVEPRDPGDVLEPGNPGDIFRPDDRELYVDDNGQVGWRTVVKGTSGDDTINVTLNPDGSADVEVNGETTHYPAEDAHDMRIDGGAGDDTITVTDNRLRLPGLGGGDVTVQGGSGDDNIGGDLGGVDAGGGTGSDTINGFPELEFPIPGNPLPRDPGGFDPMPMPRDPGDFEPPVYIPL